MVREGQEHMILGLAVSNWLILISMSLFIVVYFVMTEGMNKREDEAANEGGALEYILRTVPFNITGHPALTILVGNTYSKNLSVGMELVAAHGNEVALYEVAAAYENDVGGFARPSL